MEVLVDAFLPDHEQGCHVQRVAHSSPTAPDRPLAVFATTARAPPARSRPCCSVVPMRAERPPAGPRSGSLPPLHCGTAWLVGGGQHCAATGPLTHRYPLSPFAPSTYHAGVLVLHTCRCRLDRFGATSFVRGESYCVAVPCRTVVSAAPRGQRRTLSPNPTE